MTTLLVGEPSATKRDIGQRNGDIAESLSRPGGPGELGADRRKCSGARNAIGSQTLLPDEGSGLAESESRMQAAQTDQSSTLKPGTRSKSRRLRVTTTAPFSNAMAAMRRSMRRTLSRRALSCATRAMADSV